MNEMLVGIVKNGLFQLLLPKPESSTQFRLTSTGIHHSIPPEKGELNLIEYEQTAIAVKGYVNGNWVYSASVVDNGEPIVTALVEKVFGS